LWNKVEIERGKVKGESRFVDGGFGKEEKGPLQVTAPLYVA
jgi:hypothetical protein